MDDRKREPKPLGIRLIWFIGLWLAGVVVVALLSLIIRAALQ